MPVSVTRSRRRVAASGGGGGESTSAFFTDTFSTGDFTRTQNNALWAASQNCSVIACDSVGLTRPPTNSANAVQFRYAGPAGDFAQLDMTVDNVGTGYPELWLRYYLYYPDGTEGGTVGPLFSTPVGSIGQKQLRVYDTTTNGARTWAFGSESFYPNGTTITYTPTTATRHRVLLYTGGPGFYNSPGNITDIANGYAVPAGQWLKHEWHMRTNTVAGSAQNVGGDGILRLYINDTLQLETTTGTLTPNNARIRGLYLLGNNNAAFENANSRVYLSDVAVSATGRV